MLDNTCIGIDGCPAGWVAARRDTVVVRRDLLALLDELGAEHDIPVVAIDMPIGLASHGRRECDVRARQSLGGTRGSSIFWTATRDAVHADTEGMSPRAAQHHASDLNAARGAGRVSAQAFNLFPKIREVEQALTERPALREIVHEIHPELAFACWQSGTPDDLQPMAHRKKSGLGAHDRLRLIFRDYGRQAFEQARQAHAATRVADDDIADAYAALHCAERIAAGRHVTLPTDPPPCDAIGLPMRICI
ncbi:DUF429 domain-containing protein [Salinisphaera sp. Q1T1-3]|uniref:DUF429 domain-containing protein n=1 Tax=Salinisphaera sp. Q1T1-3 TaxID=2321229 RepID=UPI000E72667F|nr:DUF429 domain-containing protein [Salinisphaera sp. Q1T1-3]RJS93516.1 DUF429 domain-containing protein [Salinisphaera sp. Q1T1-3]